MLNLLTADDIKALTSAELNLAPHKLEISLADATQRHLRPLLGPGLLAQLLAYVNQTPLDPLSPLAALLAQVKPVLAQWALVEAWPNLLVHVTQAGVVVKTGTAQGTTSADAATLNQVLTAHRETAIWRGQELVRWLESNRADYPAYSSMTPARTGRLPLGGISL